MRGPDKKYLHILNIRAKYTVPTSTASRIHEETDQSTTTKPKTEKIKKSPERDNQDATAPTPGEEFSIYSSDANLIITDEIKHQSIDRLANYSDIAETRQL